MTRFRIGRRDGLATAGSALFAASIPTRHGRAAAMEQVTFQLGWLPGGDKAPVYVGVHKGLFAAEGLEVKIMPGCGSGDTITKVATGAADFGESGLDAFFAALAEGPVPVKAVMPLFSEAPDALVTGTTSGIMSLKDVAGKTIGTSPYTSSNLPWPLVLRANGVHPASVKLIKADPATLPGMLAAGQIDGAIDWVVSAPITGAVLAKAGKAMRVIPWSSAGFSGYSQSVITSDKMIVTRPEVVHKFVKVMTQANRLMQADPKMAADAVHAMVPEGDLATQLAGVEAALPLTFNATTTKDGLGRFNPALVKETWGWVAKERDLPLDRINPMASVDQAFAPA